MIAESADWTLRESKKALGGFNSSSSAILLLYPYTCLKVLESFLNDFYTFSFSGKHGLLN